MSEIEAGDIVCNSHHVMIYVGNGMIVHNDGNGHGTNGTLSYEKMEDYYDVIETAWRLYDEAAEKCTQANDGEEIHDTGGSFGGITGAISSIGSYAFEAMDELIGEDLDEFPVQANPPEDKEFYYKGLATEKDKNPVQPTEDNDANDRITKFLDWAVSMMITGVRGVFVGWANIVQIGASEYVAAMSGEQTNFSLDKSAMDNKEEVKKQMEESLTVEKIVYNKVPLFNVNVFSEEGSGSKDSLSGVVKTMTANWYYVARTGSIIVLLIVLIYLGIKTAISTSAEKKADFKEMFVNWLVSFMVVFVMQYIILFAINMNETFVKLLANIGGQLNLYQQVRTLTYSTEVWKGIVATFLYLALVWYLIKFIFIYFKRLFITVILIILGPITAAKYAYDKIKGNKGDTSLMLWVKEFTFSVMMQTVHALVYTIFVSIAINMAITGDAGLARIIIALVFFNFMVKAEKLVRQIMQLSGSSGGADFGDVSTDMKNIAGLATFWGASTKIFGVSRRLLEPVYNATSRIGGGILHFANRQIENGYVRLHKSELADKYGIEFNKSDTTKIDKKIDNLLREQYHMKVATIKSSLLAGAKSIGGMGQVFVSLPIFVTDSPTVGLENMVAGIKTMWHAAGEPIKGYKKFKTKKMYQSTQKSKNMIQKLMGVYGSREQGKTKKILKILWNTGLARLAGGANLVYSTVMYAGPRRYRKIYGQKLDIIENFSPEQIRLLIEAKKSEQRLMELLKKTRYKEFKGYNNEEATPLEKSLAKSYETRLEAVIEDSQKTFKQKELEDIIKTYQETTRKNKPKYRRFRNNFRKIK